MILQFQKVMIIRGKTAALIFLESHGGCLGCQSKELMKMFREDGIRDGWWSDMSKVKIELNRAGVRELMKSPEMQAILVEHANKIASASETEAYVAQTRAVVKVCGDDGNNGLLKAVGKHGGKNR